MYFFIKIKNNNLGMDNQGCFGLLISCKRNAFHKVLIKEGIDNEYWQGKDY
jgi:hypothetical protein